MKTTIHHVADCDDCRRSTLHQTVVEHDPHGRAVSKHATCEPCAQHLEDRAIAAPVLDMISARAVREQVEVSVDLETETHFGAIAN